ncbi:hypothetical protein PMAYCL1PPCAC_05558, partial [Pristionchus mayeri]
AHILPSYFLITRSYRTVRSILPMLAPLLILLPLLATAEVDYPQCDDKVDNIVRIFNSPGSENLPVQLSNVSMTTYDANFQPSCNTTGGDITFPGSASLYQGMMTVTSKFDTTFVTLKLTLKKNDTETGYVCINGEAQNGVVDDTFCTFDLCDPDVIYALPICEALTQPGVYNLSEKTPFPIYLLFNPIPYENRNLMTGMWKISAEASLGDQRIFDWTFIGTDDSGWVHITKTGVQ